jgi:hypothetical protein
MKELKSARDNVYGKLTTFGSTLTVGEISDILSQYPNDMPVLATWEGIHICLNSQSFEATDAIGILPENGGKVLVINVDDF